MPAGLPKIEMTFMLNADGILEVSAEETRSKTKQVVKMKPQYGISNDDIKQMLKDSIDHAEDDMAKRSLAEAKTEAQQLLYASKKFVSDNSTLLSEENIITIEELQSKISIAIDANDRYKIVLSMDSLNEYTKPFAEQAMDINISKALQGNKID